MAEKIEDQRNKMLLVGAGVLAVGALAAWVFTSGGKSATDDETSQEDIEEDRQQEEQPVNTAPQSVSMTPQAPAETSIELDLSGKHSKENLQ